jgi:uncharacterized membrane protein YqgA involved in biofilm formation
MTTFTYCLQALTSTGWIMILMTGIRLKALSAASLKNSKPAQALIMIMFSLTARPASTL